MQFVIVRHATNIDRKDDYVIAFSAIVFSSTSAIFLCHEPLMMIFFFFGNYRQVETCTILEHGLLRAWICAYLSERSTQLQLIFFIGSNNWYDLGHHHIRWQWIIIHEEHKRCCSNFVWTKVSKKYIHKQRKICLKGIMHVLTILWAIDETKRELKIIKEQVNPPWLFRFSIHFVFLSSANHNKKVMIQSCKDQCRKVTRIIGIVVGVN